MEFIRKHSILSASTAHRWLNCIPSARAEMHEEETCSVFAQEGTAAHKLAEIKLMYRFGKIGPFEYNRAFENFSESEHYQYYNKEFEEYVDEYVEYVISRTEGLDKYSIFFELTVDFSHIVPQGYGTADVVIVTDEYVEVIDLKFGRGVPVTALHNPQLRLYGIGALNLFPLCQKVIMTVHQPRLPSCDTEVLHKEELIKWAVEYVKPRAEKAIKGEGVFCSDEDTCRWCKLRGKCKVRADKQLELAQKEFSVAIEDNKPPTPKNLSLEQISNILYVGPMFVDWFNDVQAYALGQLVAGVKIPGYKLVEGRSNRIITDDEKVKEILLEAGFKEEEILKPQQMHGITKLESLVGKKAFCELCKEYIIKPQGKLTMAPNDDRRPEISTTQSDFAIPIEE